MIVPVTTACIIAASTLYGVPAPIVSTLLEVEGGRPGQAVRNSNGSFDLGPMQVNTIHLPELSRIYGRPQAQLRELVRDDGCFNVHVATWLLAREIARADGDFWNGVGHYHSRTPKFKYRYLSKVIDRATKLFGREIFIRADAGNTGSAAVPDNR